MTRVENSAEVISRSQKVSSTYSTLYKINQKSNIKQFLNWHFIVSVNMTLYIYLNKKTSWWVGQGAYND